MAHGQDKNPLEGNLVGGAQAKDIVDLIVNNYILEKLITGAGKEIFRNAFPILSNLAIYTYEKYRENRDYREAVGNFNYARMHGRSIKTLKQSGQWQQLSQDEENKLRASLQPMPLGDENSVRQIQSNKYEFELRKTEVELVKNDKLLKNHMNKYFELNQDGSYWDKNIDLAMAASRMKGANMSKNDFDLAATDWAQEEQKLLTTMKNVYKRKLEPHEIDWAKKEINQLKVHADKAKKRIQENNAELTKDLLKSMQLGSLEDDITKLLDDMKVVDSDIIKTKDGVEASGENKSELILMQIKALLRDYTKEISGKKLKADSKVIDMDKDVQKLIDDQEKAKIRAEEEAKEFKENLDVKGEDLEQETKITFHKDKYKTGISWQRTTELLNDIHLKDGDMDFKMPRADFELYKGIESSVRRIEVDKYKHQIMRDDYSTFSYKRKYVMDILELHQDKFDAETLYVYSKRKRRKLSDHIPDDMRSEYEARANKGEAVAFLMEKGLQISEEAEARDRQYHEDNYDTLKLLSVFYKGEIPEHYKNRDLTLKTVGLTEQEQKEYQAAVDEGKAVEYLIKHNKHVSEEAIFNDNRRRKIYKALGIKNLNDSIDIKYQEAPLSVIEDLKKDLAIKIRLGIAKEEETREAGVKHEDKMQKLRRKQMEKDKPKPSGGYIPFIYPFMLPDHLLKSQGGNSLSLAFNRCFDDLEKLFNKLPTETISPFMNG